MFLEMLNAEQREAFLVLASRVAIADGEDSREEMAAIDSLRDEMDVTGSIDMKRVLADIDVSSFDTHKSRVVAALELLRLAYADEYVHESEIAEVRNVCEAMGFPEEWLSTMGEWATRFNEVEDEDIEGELAEYRDALIEHAYQMMDV
ncbi:MAG: hypothetical protein JJ900_05980 [Rhodospirillales bacterium]|nr:hypothetical protein [Rhodospirillales bacterium]MBO6786383.1 hypothetical protein [Rhodospirillales bacterium]